MSEPASGIFLQKETKGTKALFNILQQLENFLDCLSLVRNFRAERIVKKSRKLVYMDHTFS